jgi:probable HAF family extracellular repeat protein
VADGDVVARGVTAGTATLWANHNLTLVESQLYTAGDLQLLAADTVRVRDSVEKRFIAQAGGNLYVQGNQSIDILALNHPETPFRSGGNLSLISDGIISGDAHFSSGGNFSIRNRAGGPGTFFSFYDPIISSVGDVDFGDYTGASLKIEAKGNISAGTIVITNPDTLIFGTDPDISILKSAPALILRAGVTSLENPPNFGSGSYAIANLGTLGGNFSSANAINNAGQVVGESETASGGSHAVLWQDGKPQDLGTLPRGNSSSASGINNDGQIVGTDTTSGNNRAFLWQDGKPQDLGTLFGDNFSSANGINNAGQVVGTSSTSGTNPRAFLWQDGMMSELGMLPGGNFSNAYGINNAGQVVGISSNPGGVAQAVLWDRSVPQNLGTLPGGNFSNAYGINNAGQVVGNSGIGNGNHAFLWQNGVLQDLGTLPGGNLSSANSINNAGQVVGNSGTGSGNNRAFLWQNNWMSDLNELISPASGWDALQNATAINDKGQIVGSGTIGGQTRAFLMTPSSSPPNLSREGSITVGNISTAGGPVILSATGNINQTGAITSAGGEISLTTSGGNITTGTLNSSSTSSNGGDITLKAPNDIQVNYINAQGGTNGTGGKVDISTENFFRATATFQDQNGVEASISTAGGVAGGSVIIQHGGGAKGRPFVVGDATQNGTAGAITTGTGLLGTIAPSQSFPGSYPYGNIQILTQDQPSPPPTQLPKDSSQLPKDSLLPQQNPLSQIQPPNTLPTLEVDTVVGELEDYFTRKLEQYLGRTADSPRRNLTQARETLQKIETATGVKPALIYVSFVPATVAPEPGGDKTKSLHSSPASALKGQFPPQKVTGVRATPTTSLLAQQPDQPLLKRSVQDNDQLELVLVTAKGKLVRKRLAGSTRKQVLKVTEEFFSSVTNVRDSRGYLLPAQKLYQWLVAPIEADLQAQSIQNLVFIMDTGLRLLPVAALHDRKGFLVERYSVGLMPSLSLSDTPYVDIKDAQVLAMGAEQFTDQPPLPAVPVELATITQQLWRGKSFLNEAFTLDNLKEQRRKTPFGIIHLASHGTFEPGAPGNSYIQLWDQKLKLDQLRQLGWNDPPVELLVLSACRTALGDEEAELGFAGLAVQAGVQSALASLWSVSDEGTLGLMSEFYEQLKKAPIKAEALRQTQLAMLRGQVLLEGAQLHTSGKDIPLPPNLAVQGDKNFTHPFYWAAFTMIGSPW